MSGAALAVALLFALNPNILYLQATPMTELPFLASLAALLWATLWFRDSQSLWAVLVAAAASNAASLTRYEGWFLIPFVCLYLLVSAKHKWHAILFGGCLALPWDRWHGSRTISITTATRSSFTTDRIPRPRSTSASSRREDFAIPAITIGSRPRVITSPLRAGSRDGRCWSMGIAGTLVAVAKRVWWALFLLLLPPLFYVWSMHSSGTPIFVPDLPPYGWYNTRYAIAAVPFAAFAAGALVTLVPARFQAKTSIILALAVTGVWGFSGASSISWKESEVNSEARRAWTAQAASFLAREYRPGSGIIFPFGDLTGVLREAGIPLREGLHEGNGVAFDAAMARPDLLLLSEDWPSGDWHFRATR